MKLECYQCGEKIEEDYFRNKNDKIYCDDCYHENFEFICPICEEHHENPEEPVDHYVYLHNEQDGYIPGFYNVVKFPLFSGDMFFTWLWDDALRLASTNRVSEVGEYEYPSGFICKECFDQSIK